MNFARLDLTLDPQEEIRCRLKFRHLVRELSAQTHFSRAEAEALLLIHYKLTRRRPMDRKYFRRVLYALLGFQNDVLIDYIFSAFDRGNRLAVAPDAWVLGMSIILRGTVDERLLFCFRCYDFMNTGYLGKEQMLQLLKKDFRHGERGEDPEDVARDLIELLVKRMDRDRDGRISLDDYRLSVWANEELMEFLGQCLPARPAVYAFMSTFTSNVTTMHAMRFGDRAPTDTSTITRPKSGVMSFLPQTVSAIFGGGMVL